MQQSTNRILSERKRFYFNRGIEFIIKDSIPDSIDMEKVIGLLRGLYVNSHGVCGKRWHI